MFRLFGRKKGNSQDVCHKCGAALRSGDTYMLNQQKYCGKCYPEEKAGSETAASAQGLNPARQDAPKSNGSATGKSDAAGLASILNQLTKEKLQNTAQSKDRTEPVSDKELIGIFTEYFAPNTDFFSVPGSEKFKAYFNAINHAKMEMLQYALLYENATRRKKEELADMIKNPAPGITNMLICGLIFCMGDYAVIPDRLLCVDFGDKIPSCISVFLLLTAQKLPEEKRIQVLDTGDGVDPKPLLNALSSLTVCDPRWDCKVLSMELPQSKASAKEWKAQ